ncbi:MAG: hypothetical protein REH83_06170 [Rickettsiella sp.]|nr:hypothetical protein [Rickettsiella sp.]
MLDLLSFVSKNKIIPRFLSQLTPENPKVKTLKQAIEHGNSTDEIWNDADCHLYLIYLIRQELIPYSKGATAYLYLMVKMQYTPTQILRQEDSDTKRDYSVEVESLVAEGEISVLGNEYLTNVCDDLEKIGFNIDIQELESYVLNLPSIEQWLIKTEFSSLLEHPSDQLIDILINNIPLLQIVDLSYSDYPYTQYVIPSLSLSEFIFQKMNSAPMQLANVFGSVNPETLRDAHRKNYHIAAIYSPNVRSNLKTVHEWRAGPVAAWLHDLGHTFWANMLTDAERQFILEIYGPALEFLKEKLLEANNQAAADILKKAIHESFDFDLTNVYYDFNKPQERCGKYLDRVFKLSDIFPCRSLLSKPIGMHYGDALYFLLHKYSNDPGISKENQEIYMSILENSTMVYERPAKIITALEAVAENFNLYPDKLLAVDVENFFESCKNHDGNLPINWHAWLAILNSPKTSEEIWMDIVKNNDRENELTTMLIHGLIIFEPYIKFTAEKRKEFRNLVENILEKNTAALDSNTTLFNKYSFFQQVPAKSRETESDTLELSQESTNDFRRNFIR